VIYPFGFGLSYTSFTYNNLKIDPGLQKTTSNIKISFEVTNTGDILGDEVVQLYINDIVSSVTTYEKVLRGFERLKLEPGETQTVEFILEPDDLALYNRVMERVVEPGEFEIMVGASSVDIKLKDTFLIK